MVIPGEVSTDELSEASADLKFSLPASPTSALLDYLMAACQEVRRAGDHMIGEIVVSCWDQEAGDHMA